MSEPRNWIVGAALSCDIVLDQETVSSRHCRISHSAEGFSVEDLGSSNGTFVNGRRVTHVTLLDEADAITLGRDVALSLPPVSDVGSECRVITIGAAPDNDHVIDDPVVSGYHARLLISHGRVRIEDLNSTNGTAVGHPGNQIQSAIVTSGASIFLGSVEVSMQALLDDSRTALQSEVPWLQADRRRVFAFAAALVFTAVAALGFAATRNGNSDKIVGDATSSRPTASKLDTIPSIQEVAATDAAPTAAGRTAAKLDETLVAHSTPIIATATDTPANRVSTQKHASASSDQVSLIPGDPLVKSAVHAPEAKHSDSRGVTTSQAIYQVVAQLKPSKKVRVGIAWAATETALVTSGAAIITLRDLEHRVGEALQVSVIGLTEPHAEFAVSQIELHPVMQPLEKFLAWKAAIKAVPEKASNALDLLDKLGADEEEIISDLQAAEPRCPFFDLAVIQVDGVLPSTLSSATNLHPAIDTALFTVFNGGDPDKPMRPPVATACRVQSIVHLGETDDGIVRFQLKLERETDRQNFIGSPVLNSVGEVVGVVGLEPAEETDPSAASGPLNSVPVSHLRGLLPDLIAAGE